MIVALGLGPFIYGEATNAVESASSERRAAMIGRARTPLDDIMSTDVLAQAIEKASPYFGDTTDAPSAGAKLLGVLDGGTGSLDASVRVQ